MVEIAGERVLAPSCCRYPPQGMKVTTNSERAREGAEDGAGTADDRHAREAEYTRHNEVDEWADKLGVGKPRFPATRPEPAQDASHAAITVNLDACIQCTRCVRACRDEQVNDVIGLAFRGETCEDRVRPGRPDGQLDLRGLRRMRAGLPDRRPDAGARRGLERARQAGRFGLPVLRRRLPADLQRQGQQDPVRRRTRRPGQPRPPVRQGPLRLRLRPPPASPDEAADPPRRRAQDAATSRWTRAA